MLKRLLLAGFILCIGFGAGITVPTKNTGDTLSAAEFSQFVEALRYNSRDVGVISASALNTTGTVTANKLTDGTISITGGNLTGATGITATTLTGTLGTAAQANVTSLGQLTALNVNGNVIVTGNITSVGASSATIKAETAIGGTTPYIKVKNPNAEWYMAVEQSGSDGHFSIGNVGGAERLQFTTAGDIYTTTWTDYSETSTVTGFSSFSTKSIYYKRIGNLVFVSVYIAGTSNATSLSFTLPHTSQTGTFIMNSAQGSDNGSGLTSPAMLYMTAATSTVTVYKDFSGATWTGSGTKSASGSFIFEAN